MSSSFVRLVAAIWLGGGLFLAAVAAPAAFSASHGPTAAANVVGAMLARWHYLALGAPLVLLVLEWTHGHLTRTFRVLVLAAALLLAAGEVGADLRIRYVRASTTTPISELAPGHPTRRSFGRLHGISMVSARAPGDLRGSDRGADGIGRGRGAGDRRQAARGLRARRTAILITSICAICSPPVLRARTLASVIGREGDLRSLTAAHCPRRRTDRPGARARAALRRSRRRGRR